MFLVQSFFDYRNKSIKDIFLKNSASSNLSDILSYFFLIFQKIDVEIFITGSPLLYTGRVNEMAQTSKFIGTAMGVNEIKKCPRFLADWLKLEDAHLYTGHSIRRTTATHLADAGAPAPMMKHKFNWKSEKMTNEYVSSSKKNQGTIAGMLDKQLSGLDPSAEMRTDGRSQNHQRLETDGNFSIFLMICIF